MLYSVILLYTDVIFIIWFVSKLVLLRIGCEIEKMESYIQYTAVSGKVLRYIQEGANAMFSQVNISIFNH